VFYISEDNLTFGRAEKEITLFLPKEAQKDRTT